MTLNSLSRILTILIISTIGTACATMSIDPPSPGDSLVGELSRISLLPDDENRLKEYDRLSHVFDPAIEETRFYHWEVSAAQNTIQGTVQYEFYLRSMAHLDSSRNNSPSISIFVQVRNGEIIPSGSTDATFVGARIQPNSSFSEVLEFTAQADNSAQEFLTSWVRTDQFPLTRTCVDAIDLVRVILSADNISLRNERNTYAFQTAGLEAIAQIYGLDIAYAFGL